jgi:xanthine dehydrogenase accessory factor
VLVDADGASLPSLDPAVVIDARIAKRNLGTTREDAPLVIALGPGFEAGKDCHAVIETNRGHSLGRVIWHGSAEPNTGRPGSVLDHTSDRVLRAPAEGHVAPQAEIGAQLAGGDLVAMVGALPVYAPFDGVLRGLIHPSVYVPKGMKIGDVDPRGRREHCFSISEKALAIGGGVLEALFSAPQLAGRLSG